MGDGYARGYCWWRILRQGDASLRGLTALCSGEVGWARWTPWRGRSPASFPREELRRANRANCTAANGGASGFVRFGCDRCSSGDQNRSKNYRTRYAQLLREKCRWELDRWTS